MKIVHHSGWPHCAYLESQGIELYVILDVGPRIIHYGLVGGVNELVIHEKDAGKTGGDTFHSYGGHRLWIAPEEVPKTVQPDNDPVDHNEENGWQIFRSKPDKYLKRKEMRLKFEGAKLVILHRVYNESAYAARYATWSPTQMATGGECLFPHAPFETHDQRLLPARPLVLWAYTKMDDPRFDWGGPLIRLRQDESLGPTKVGMLVQQGYAAYANHGNLFLKRFRSEAGKEYPDFNCNFETFTREDMLEIESLGYLQLVEPGGFAEHQESWYLLADAHPPTDNRAAAEWLSEIAHKHPL